MTMQEFEDFLIKNSGVTTLALNNIIGMAPVPTSSFFFKPYQSKLDPLFRASTIITGPVVLAAYALGFAFLTVFNAFKSLGNLIILDPKEAKNSISDSAAFLIGMVLEALAAVLSPIVNLIDLIGGGVTSLTNSNNDEGYASSVEENALSY